MSNKNTAKEWQKGWYQIHVGDTEIAVRTKRNGKVYETLTLCHPDDEFSLSEGVKIAMERLEQVINPNVIRIGDKVKIKDTGGMYCNYTQWVVDNVTNIEDVAHWQYDQNNCNMTSKYIVKYIGVNEFTEERMAYIMEIHTDRCYLFHIDELEKING